MDLIHLVIFEKHSLFFEATLNYDSQDDLDLDFIVKERRMLHLLKEASSSLKKILE